MSKHKFWATIALAVFLGVLGFVLGGIAPLPSPYGVIQSRILYALFGVLTGLLSFAQIASWVVKATTKLLRQLISTLASEIFEQFNRAASHLPSSHPEEELPSHPIILDTSSIIDGRILDVAKTGFLYGHLVIPGFVLEELQQVADSADSLKRARGRRGFEVINGLKKIKKIKLQVWEKEKIAALGKRVNLGKNVDERLVDLGKAVGGKIFTADFNLGSVAKIRGVEVLNLNELGNALKTLPVPGEKITVRIIHLGKDKDQGVGYLPDGTMVVVKDAQTLIGEEVEVEVSKILQGASGRMIFGKLSTSLNS